MAIKSPKIEVIDSVEKSRVPFLRGILTASLLKAGLPFDTAYDIADKIRDELKAGAEISTDDLRNLVVNRLKNEVDEHSAERYLESKRRPISITVGDDRGPSQPFSKVLLCQSLESCALSREDSHSIAATIEQQLIKDRIRQLSTTELARRTYEHLRINHSEAMAHRYLIWRAFLDSGKPLIVLIGGTAGSGKSTIASELAHRLNILRTQSTDMLREVVRLMIPKRLLPTLHISSFCAGDVLPFRDSIPEANQSPVEAGYVTQVDHVGVALDGAIQRALRERLSLIVEGVHVIPSQQAHYVNNADALVIPLILAVFKKKTLEKRFISRSSKIPSRRAKRYLKNFDAIWQIQSFLMAQADEYQIPIIPNDDQEETIQMIMDRLSSILAKEFEVDPSSIFS